VRLYRFGFKKYINDLSGTGGLYRSGRWHNRGTRIVYFSETISLAKLEVLANTTRIPKSYFLLTVEVPEHSGILEISADELPSGWNAFPPNPEIISITEKWIAENKDLLMCVPSVHSPLEQNFLLNPQHKAFNQVKILKTAPHYFDERLKKSSQSVSEVLESIWRIKR